MNPSASSHTTGHTTKTMPTGGENNWDYNMQPGTEALTKGLYKCTKYFEAVVYALSCLV